MGELDLNELLLSPEFQAAGVLVVALVVGYAISTALAGALARAAARTHRDLQQQLLALLRRPVLTTAVLLALEWAGDRARLTASQHATLDAVLGTIALVMWGAALVRAADEVLLDLHRRANAGQQGLAFMRGRTSGLVHFVLRASLVLGGLYVAMVLWGLDARVWQVSAGVAGAVLGLAAQDSLGNLISAVFIVGDAPLRIGDVVRVDATLRGRVTDIGWRSTRILTNDGIEVNIPNGRLGAQRVINESAGPHPAVRIASEFAVEYGRTPEEIRAIVLPGIEALPELQPGAQPELQFRGRTEAGLRFALQVHVADAGRRLQALDAVNSHVLRALRAAGVALAHPSHDVQLDGPLAGPLQAAVAGRSGMSG